jgi:hypothetical protein
VTLHELGGSKVIRWADLIRAKSGAGTGDANGDDLLVIQARGGPLVVLPRRFFTSETDWQAVLRWAETRDSGRQGSANLG